MKQFKLEIKYNFTRLFLTITCVLSRVWCSIVYAKIKTKYVINLRYCYLKKEDRNSASQYSCA